ncbi:MAG TPA: response regulator [Longimicrobiales bacterium]|nr:response regulator [Longimicrobiales bacterium]
MLLVDDDASVRRVLERWLSRCGATVYQAGDAEGASLVIDRERDGLDLVISDVDLPDRTGIWVAGLVRRVALRTPVILITGGDLDDCRPADLLLRKPLDLGELGRRAQALLTTRDGGAER